MSVNNDCPFCGILNGNEPGTIVVQDDEKRMALIKNIHPESTVHWLAVPYEHAGSTKALGTDSAPRFLELVQFAMHQTQALMEDEPQLQKGFTLKIHFGSFETIEHPKVHILAME